MKNTRWILAAFAVITISAALSTAGLSADSDKSQPEGVQPAAPEAVKAPAAEAPKPAAADTKPGAEAAKPAAEAAKPEADAAKPAAEEAKPSAEAPKPAAAQEGKAEPAGPVAVVNGVPIPRAEYERYVQAQLQNLRMMGGAEGEGPELNDVIKAALIEQLVSRELLFQESAKFPDEGRKQKVEEQLQVIRSRFPSPEAYQEALKNQGLSEKDLDELVGKQVTVQYYVETEIAAKAAVSDADVKKFYEENKDKFLVPEEVRASHVLIRSESDAKPEEREKAKAKAEDVRKRAAAGEDFAKLARENSEDEGSAATGGDLGFFSRDRMVPAFAEAAFALKVAEVSGVVETEFGFHVIQCTDRKPARTIELDEVKERISGYLKSKALDDAVQAKVQELRGKAKVEVTLP